MGRDGRRGLPTAVLGLALLCGATTTACTSDATTTAPSTDDRPAASTSTSSTPRTTATTTATSQASPTTTSTSPPTTTSVPVAAAAVDRLEVRQGDDPTAPPYVRDQFDGGDWAYDPATGCTTRERVLIEESLVPPTVDDRCRSTGGRWRSAYDGVETEDPADLQIDHFVPLADAWRSGAWRWTMEQRLRFANDLEDPATLIAVTGSTNQSKSDSRPDEWLPPDRSAWCEYARNWVEVKRRWALSVVPSEKATLVQILSGC